MQLVLDRVAGGERLKSACAAVAAETGTSSVTCTRQPWLPAPITQNTRSFIEDLSMSEPPRS